MTFEDEMQAAIVTKLEALPEFNGPVTVKVYGEGTEDYRANAGAALAEDGIVVLVGNPEGRQADHPDIHEYNLSLDVRENKTGTALADGAQVTGEEAANQVEETLRGWQPSEIWTALRIVRNSHTHNEKFLDVNFNITTKTVIGSTV